MKLKIKEYARFFITVVVSLMLISCSQKRIAFDKDWVDNTEEIQITLQPSNQKYIVQSEEDLNDFMKLINGLKYTDQMTISESIEDGILAPGTEYIIILVLDDQKEEVHISYGINDQALGVEDQVYVLENDISEQLNTWVQEIE